MAEIAVLCVFAVIVTEIYARTKHPKLSALINSGLGIGGMLLSQILAVGTVCVTPYNAALSAILGIPGAVLLYIFNLWG